LQAETIDGSSGDSFQVSVIGLVVVGCGLAEIARGRRVDGAGIVTSGSEGTPDWPVVATGALDSDHHVSELVGGDRLAERSPGIVERRAMVLNHSRRAADTAVEVSEHPLGADLGTVHGDDPKMFSTDSLDPGG
jgi:hypothetical protein